MQDFKHFDPKQAAMDEARGLLEAAARAAMADGSLPEKELPAFVVEVPNDVKNGDLASNFAMAGARVFGMPPRKIAEAVAASSAYLRSTRVSIAARLFSSSRPIASRSARIEFRVAFMSRVLRRGWLLGAAVVAAGVVSRPGGPADW